MNSEPNSGRLGVASALRTFYREHALGESGGEQSRWAKVKMGWFSFYIPNTSTRKQALLFHDVHHLATGYDTDLRGEAEIAAFEIASGCGRYRAAWLLNYSGFVLGLFISPRRTFRAFVRGRHSLNLYYDMLSRAEIRAATVESIRERMRLNEAFPATRISDRLMFALWCSPVVATLTAATAVLIRWL